MVAPSYRVNPLVSGAPALVDGTRTLVFEHAVDRHQFELSSSAFLNICNEATDWTPHSELVEYLMERYVNSEREAESVLESLSEHGMLVTRDSYEMSPLIEEFLWSEVGYYDAYVRDWPFMDYSEDDIAATVSERLDAYENAEEPPTMIKRYPNAKVVDLPEQADHDRLRIHQTAPSSTTTVDTAYILEDVTDPGPLGGFSEAFKMNDPTDPVELDDQTVSTLLFYTFGKIGSIVNADIPHGPLVLKTSPGHGSLHPIEAYPIVTNVEGIPDGTYHYSVAEHELECIGDVPSRLVKTDGGEPESKVHIALTAVVERCMWKYRGARDIRNILHDLGHLIGTYDIVAAALGVDASIKRRMDPATIAASIDVNVFDEPPVGMLTVR